jgi:hypothetical protein
MLATIKDLRDYLGEKGSGEDPRLTKALSRASAMIVGYLNRGSIELATYTAELYDGNGTDTLQVRYPIKFPADDALAVTMQVFEGTSALTVSALATDDPDVLVDKELGHLMRPFSRWIPQRRWYSVTYSAGYSVGAIPEPIVQAALDLAALITVEKNRIGIQSKTTGNQVTNYVREIPKEVKASLDPYRDLSLSRRAV